MDVSDVEPLSAVACPECGAPSVITAMIDHFELTDVIGHGGMGAVYRAHDTSLDRPVALKLLRKSSGSPEQIAQLETEAAITASINHPHVVRVFSTGMDHGRFYIAMELVEKGTLDSLIELQGRVAEAQVLDVGIQIASGLRAAQHAGLIHRDVKPGNILFADAQTAKIVDFGLAIFAEDEAKVRGEIWGTPYYVAPEKLDHKPEDFRSDIYSLGGTLFHALAGRPPFEAENASMVALKHLKSQAVSLQAFAPHISSNTAYVINRTLAKDPDQRYQSYDELIQHLEYARTELLAGGGKPPVTKRVVIESDQDKQAMGWVVMGLMLLLVIGGIFAFIYRDRLFTGDEAASAEAAKTHSATITKAVEKMVKGAPKDAVESLNKLVAQKPAQPQLNWAETLTGLAQLMAERRPDSSATFRKIEDRGLFTKKEPDKALAEFFVETSGKMQGEANIDPTSVQVKNPLTFESVKYLLYGVKNWEVGAYEDGAEFLRRFDQAQPAGKDAWLGELKPIATSYLAQFKSYQAASDLAKKAKSVEDKRDAITALGKVQGRLEAKAKELSAKLTAEVATLEKDRGALWAQGKVPNGRYRLVSRTSGKTIEVEGRGKEDGRKVQQANYIRQPHALWNFIVQPDGSYMLVSNDTGKALTSPKGQDDNLVGMVQGAVNTAQNQRWKIQKVEGDKPEDSFWKLTLVSNGKALTAAGTFEAAGATVVQKDDNGSSEQLWKILPP